MKQLPKMLRSTPVFFYGLAIIMGVYQFATNLGLVWASEGHLYDPTDKDRFEWLAYVISSQPFAVGVSEAAYMAANGAIVHVLIAIFDKVEGTAE